MKIAILGYSGSGKSTLAKKLAGYYKAPALYLDTVQFLPGWAERDKEEGRAIVADFMQNESWVIDGNYGYFLQKERLEQADYIIILALNRAVCFARALKRFLQNKNKTRESMAAGCTEKFDAEFMRWILHDGRTKKKREHYKRIAAQYKNKTTILYNQRQVNKFAEQIMKSRA